MQIQTRISKIQCNICQSHYSAMDVIKQNINHVKSIGSKAVYAEELYSQAKGLIECQKYECQKKECADCLLIAILNIKTADLVIKAKRLSL